jgi:pimeloyl-[acyl-carrier protein] methyl ester esterase
MHLVFVHGWGFNAGMWGAVLDHLPDAEVSLVDLGFVRGGPAGADDWPDDAIAVGHSLGVLWLLHEAREREGRVFRGLVSIEGFDCFSCHIPRARTAAMRRELKRDASATLHAFWRACGPESFAPKEALDVKRLDEGLGWLLDWDARTARASLDIPMLALAARDDAVVPEAMSRAIWGDDNIAWSPEGGHVLPLRRPEWCARHVLDFAHATRP